MYIANYKEMKERQQEEVNNFPMFFAYSDEQFAEGMNKLGLNISDTDKIFKFSHAGCFCRKSDVKDLYKMLDRHQLELKNAMNDDKFLIDMFSYELANHEYCISRDVTDTLESLNLTIEEVRNDERLSKALKYACSLQ